VRFDALREIVLGTDSSQSMLIFAVSKRDVEKVAVQLAEVLRHTPCDGRAVLSITDGDTDSLAEKRSKSARFRTGPTILVTNSAGARGLDHRDLSYVVKYAEPSGLAESVQVSGRGARRSNQRAVVTQLYNRRGWFRTASVFREDCSKLAALSDVIAVEETIRYCARSMVRFYYGEVRRPHDASRTNGCCHACTRLYEADGRWTAVARRVKVPEIEQLLNAINAASTAFSAATFKKLVEGELAGWDSGRLSVDARERVVLTLVCDGVLVITPHPSGWCTAIGVVPKAVLERRRRLQGAWCEIDFLLSELT
jgi:superfamily II DNA helicase RecQ